MLCRLQLLMNQVLHILIQTHLIAKSLEHCKVNDNLLIKGELHSREYTKRLSDTEVEIRVAHELVVTSFEVIEEEKHAV